jgi:hypothetical protein
VRRLFPGLVLAAALTACSGAPAATPTPTPHYTGPTELPPQYHVVYLLTGTATGADITYTTSAGTTQQESGVAVPLTAEDGSTQGIGFDSRPGDAVYISAQATDDAPVTIGCEIQIDGATFKQASSDGRYVIATCSGLVPAGSQTP